LAIGACTKREDGLLNCPIELGGVCVRPGDLVFGDADGLVVIGRDRAEAVCALALARREKERLLIENLGKGKTTLELLGLGAAE
jgi:4-hydroxy-4-methyl-2-oxoglutarate aldolase